MGEGYITMRKVGGWGEYVVGDMGQRGWMG